MYHPPHSQLSTVRKAYRRKALETHPDRLPQGASPAEKAVAEERFRKVITPIFISSPQLTMYLRSTMLMKF